MMSLAREVSSVDPLSSTIILFFLAPQLYCLGRRSKEYIKHREPVIELALENRKNCEKNCLLHELRPTTLVIRENQTLPTGMLPKYKVPSLLLVTSIITHFLTFQLTLIS